MPLDGFEKFGALAHTRNLRVVIWNRRDYTGSTKYTDSEMDDLKNGKKVFLERWGIQLAEFMRQFIEKESIPAITADRRAGGIAVMGWSLGIIMAMPLLADAQLINPELSALLGPYFKDIILHGM